MRTLLLIMICAFFGMLQPLCAEEPTVSVPVVNTPFVLDGKLDEPQWAQANAMTRFFPEDGPATEARVLADATHLYFGFRCADEHPESLAGNVTTPNGQTWQDDAIEIFVNPGHQFTSLIQFVINCKGVAFQNGSGVLYARARQDFGLETCTSVGKDYWILECRVPLERIGLSLPRYRAGVGDGFALNFGRDLRNPAYKRKDFCTSKRGYFTQEGYLPFRFTGDTPSIEIAGDENDALVNARSLSLTFKNRTKQVQNLQYRWYPLVSLHEDSLAQRIPLPLAIGKTRKQELPISEFIPGNHVWRLEMWSGETRLFVRDFLFTLDPPVQIAPDFPCCTDDAGEKTVRVLLAPYAQGRFRLSLTVRQDAIPVFTQEIGRLSAVNAVPFSKAFASLHDGPYTITAILYNGTRPVYGHEYHFVKGKTTIDTLKPNLIVANWGFEDTQPKRPELWKDANPAEPDTQFPTRWSLAKKPAWWSWGNLSLDPRSIYEGQRSLVLRGQNPGAQCHVQAPFFKVKLNARYHLRLMARGNARLSARYYMKNQAGRWISRYFDTRIVQLTDQWTEYQFDTVNFNVDTNTSWDGSSLGDDKKPVDAALVIWVHDDGLAYIDNVILAEETF